MFSWKNLILSLFIIFSVSACGSKKNTSNQSAPATTALEAQASPAPDAPPSKIYTSFSPKEETQGLKEEVPATEGNKLFAQSIEKVSLSSKANQPEDIQINLKLVSSPQPFQFEGVFQKTGSLYTAEMKELSGQNSGLKVNASSSTPDFSVVTVIVTDTQGRKAGIIIREEERTLKLRVPVTEGAQDQAPDPETKKIMDQYEGGKAVVVTATEIYSAKSYYEVRDKADQPDESTSILKGELLETNGSEVETSAEGAITQLGTPVLVGNTSDGEGLVWKIASDKSNNLMSVYEILEPRKPSEKAPGKPGPKPVSVCGIQIAGKVIHPYVKQILNDCQDKLVSQYMTSFWLSPNYGKKKLEHFLDLNQASSDENPNGDGAQFKAMVTVLKRQNYPSVLGLITILESDFQPKAAPPKKLKSSAYGWWQFLKATARDYGLALSPVDERTQIEPATLAATKYFDRLLSLWHGDLKMAIASYKYGEGNLQDVDDPSGKRRQLSTDFSKDFWELVQYGMIDSDTKDYVLKFISGALISFSPQTYGLKLQPVDFN